MTDRPNSVFRQPLRVTLIVASILVLPLFFSWFGDWYPYPFPCIEEAKAPGSHALAKVANVLFPVAHAVGCGGLPTPRPVPLPPPDQCIIEGSLTAACTVSNESKQKALSVINYHSTGKLVLKEGATTCSGSPDAKQSVQSIADGQCATTCPSYACQNPTSISPSLLQAMLNLADNASRKPRITSVTGDTHDSKKSLHYYGQAFDFGCQLSTDPWSCSSTHETAINQAAGGLVSCALHNGGTTKAHFHCSRTSF